MRCPFSISAFSNTKFVLRRGETIDGNIVSFVRSGETRWRVEHSDRSFVALVANVRDDFRSDFLSIQKFDFTRNDSNRQRRRDVFHDGR